MQRSRTNLAAVALLAATALASGIPAIGQKSPESILPPGFGDPVKEPPKEGPSPDGPDGTKRTPADLLPGLSPETQRALGGAPRSPGGNQSAAAGPGTPAGNDGSGTEVGDSDSLTNQTTAQVPVESPYDIPPELRRSTAEVGVLGPEDGGVGIDGFGGQTGHFVMGVMRHTRAPIASRWVSIALRRALLSPVATPGDVNGADFVAERAWMLLRMGEADASRLLIQSVDVDQFTPKLFQVAMQSALANADPASLCPIVDRGEQSSDETGWVLAQAMCAGLSGESGTATQAIYRAKHENDARGIDLLLAEKVVGAGTNSRRAITIQWDDVKQLTAWRFGLASSVGVEVPDRLMSTVGVQTRAWQARVPILSLSKRVPAADWAAALGVYSNDGLVDLYGAMLDSSDPGSSDAASALKLQAAYTASTPAERLASMTSLWAGGDADPLRHYGRMVLTARAAARLPVAETAPANFDVLIASMLSAGLDVQAMRWRGLAAPGSEAASNLAWGLLAVGAPQATGKISAGDLKSYASTVGGDDQVKAKFLFAGLAGLGRIASDDVSGLAERFAVPIGRQTLWSRGIDRAAANGERATVLLLSAAGLQTLDWKQVPADHLYHIVAALRRVGMEPEARMVAAEALARA
jgi:hypothetical protein